MQRVVLGFLAAAWLQSGTTPADAAPPRPYLEPRPGPVLFRNVAVFGSDDRVPLTRDRPPLKDKVGLLFSPRARTLCTAFCVGEDVIATAAHCLFRTAGDTYPSLEDYRFGPSKDNLKSQVRLAGFATRTTLQQIMSGSISLNVRPPIDATNDWALAKLASPACKGNVLALEPMSEEALAQEASKRRLFMVGYHRDFAGWRAALSPACEIKRVGEVPDADSVRRDFVDADRLLLHTCDTGGASSGSPILMQTATGPVVVGINVGTYVQSKVLINNGEVVHRFKASEIANTAASIAPVASALQQLQQSEPLVSSAQIRDVQRALKQMGLFAGPTDGLHDPKLRLAIEEYQRREMMPMTGLLNQDLFSRLIAPSIITGSTTSIKRSNGATR